MTVIRTSCSTCGDVDLAPDAVRLVVSSVAARSYYAFTCPGCWERVRKSATAEMVRLLCATGIRPERVCVPAEALEDHPRTALTWDDVLDFADWIRAAHDLVPFAERGAARRSRA